MTPRLIQRGGKVYEQQVAQMDTSRIGGRFAEISENVDRGHLTPARRRDLIRQYVKLLREHDKLLKVISAQPAPKLKSERNPKGAGRNKSAVSHAAEKFGVGKSTIKRALAGEREPASAPKPPGLVRPPRARIR